MPAGGRAEKRKPVLANLVVPITEQYTQYGYVGRTSRYYLEQKGWKQILLKVYSIHSLKHRNRFCDKK